jgi:hypothetical protein
MFRTVDEEAVFAIPGVRLRLLNMNSGKKYSRIGIDMNKRSDLRPISIA